jgi:hypothetical protein
LGKKNGLRVFEKQSLLRLRRTTQHDQLGTISLRAGEMHDVGETPEVAIARERLYTQPSTIPESCNGMEGGEVDVNAGEWSSVLVLFCQMHWCCSVDCR